MTCTACLRALRHPQPQALHAEALSGWEKTYHAGPLVPRRADGREARCLTGPQYERNVHRARRHAYRFLRLGGGPADPARMSSRGRLKNPHGETNPG